MISNNTGRKITRRSRRGNDASLIQGVKRHYVCEGSKLPLAFSAEYPGITLPVWLDNNRGMIQKELQEHGAILFRNFSNNSIEDFNEVVKTWSPNMLDYDFGSTPRTNLQAKIFTSTEYPADQEIVMHNEMAYTKKYPTYLWFYCNIPAREGGCTPLSDSRKMCELLGEELVNLFETRKIIYCRNYKKGIDIPWQNVFRTNDKTQVAAYCEANAIEYEWVTEDHLRTREHCEAVLRHPDTNEKVWFNQAHLFHPSNLSEELFQQLANISTEDLPRNVLWGNGDPIDPTHLSTIRAAFEKAKVRFDWQTGDIVLIDNLLAAHGRDSYKGPRKIVVAMQGALKSA